MSAGDIYGVLGTPVVWRDSGGDEVITCNSMAAANAREGARHDFGAGAKPIGFRWLARTQWTSAPTIYSQLEIHLALWDDETGPGDAWGNLAGADTAYSTAAGIAKRLSLRFIGGPRAETSAVGPFITGGEIWFPARYVSPFLYNGGNVALAATATYATLLRLTPIYAQVQA